MKRAAIYARVSTDDQAEKGYSLPSQVNACQMFAERAGFQTVTLLEDCSGATPIADRPKGTSLADMVKRREVDAVIVYQVDRLSRDIVNLLATVQMWLRAGIEVYALDIGQVKSELDIILVIKGWQGSDERAKIIERTTRGRRAKAQAGKVVGATRPVYGYKYVKDIYGKPESLEPIDEIAQIIRMIYQWYVYDKISTKMIARRLSEAGIPTPGEVNKIAKRKRAAGMWNRYAIREIISNEVYAGVWYYGMRIGKTKNTRPRDEWIAVEVPAIVDRETWELAQAQKARNIELSKRNGKNEYLLSGYIRCVCGWRMAGVFDKKNRYYFCGRNSDRHTKIEKSVCNAHLVRADAIEFAVWESIIELFRDQTELERLLMVAQDDERQALDPKQDELISILGMIDNTELDAVEIGQALKRASGIVAKTLEKDMEEVNRRYDALCKRRDELIEELKGAKLTDSAIQDALQFAENVRLGIENADFETKRRTLEFLGCKVIVDEMHFAVGCLLGEWAGDIPAVVNGKIVMNSFRGCSILAALV